MAPFEPPKPRSAFDDRCITLLDESPRRHSRHCFRSALNHLACAEKIFTVDPEMCAFRGITAEEEAASGLMHCLKECGYENAEKLKPKSHTQKSSVTPFLSILGTFFHQTFAANGLQVRFHIQNQDGERRLTIGIPMVVRGVENYAYPVPPLNFSVTSDAQRVSYKQQIAGLIEKTGARDILSHVKTQANQRNTVLYAGPDGYPKLLGLKPDFLSLRQVRVLAMMRAYLFIHPYREHQPFVQDALDAFLAMLGVLENHGLHEEI